MKRSEIAKLLSVIEATEKSGRRPSDEDIHLWLMFATEGAWESYDAALRAYVVHRSEHPDFPLRPGHITQVLERVRRVAREEFNRDHHELVPPRSVREDPHPLAWSRWIRDRAIRHQAEAVAGFACGDAPAVKAIGAAT